MIHLRSTHSWAWLLLFARDPQGVYRIMAGPGSLPGKVMEVPPGVFLHEWLMDQSVSLLMGNDPVDRRHLEISDVLQDTIKFTAEDKSQWLQHKADPTHPDHGDTEVQVYLATYNQQSPLPSNWIAVPELFKGLADSRLKKIYLRVWQVLMGSHKEKSCKVVSSELL